MSSKVTPLQKAIQQGKSIADEHPYKVVGNHDTYSDYNQGWEACANRFMQLIEELLPAEREFASDCWEGGKCRAYNSTDYPDFDTFFSQYNQTEQK